VSLRSCRHERAHIERTAPDAQVLRCGACHATRAYPGTPLTPWLPPTPDRDVLGMRRQQMLEPDPAELRLWAGG